MRRFKQNIVSGAITGRRTHDTSRVRRYGGACLAWNDAPVYDCAMRFPRALRLDESDSQIYESLAMPGEWAVPGSFAFLDDDPTKLTGKRRQAFLHGFLGTVSFGWSTLAQVDEINEAEYQGVIDRLAAHFVAHHGAPDLASAVTVVQEEADFAASICDFDLRTLMALKREMSVEGIVESFKVVRPPSADDHSHIKLWSIEEDNDPHS